RGAVRPVLRQPRGGGPDRRARGRLRRQARHGRDRPRVHVRLELLRPGRPPLGGPVDGPERRPAVSRRAAGRAPPRRKASWGTLLGMKVRAVLSLAALVVLTAACAGSGVAPGNAQKGYVVWGYVGHTSTSAAAGTQVVLVDAARSEEHTSELQSRENLVCRLLLEKKN